MEKTKISEAQKAAQKKYDKKTKIISVKYTPADMDKYERMKSYLERTGKSCNSFIKELIDDFFSDKYSITEKKIAQYFYDYNVSAEYLDKLKEIRGSEEKYNIVIKCYIDSIEYELSDAYEFKGCAFEEWVDNLEEEIEMGTVDLTLGKREFEKEINKSINGIIGAVEYI